MLTNDEMMKIMKESHAKVIAMHPDMKPMCDMYEVIFMQALKEEDETGGVSTTTQIIIEGIERLFRDSLAAFKVVDMFKSGDIESVLKEMGVDLSIVMDEDETTDDDDSGEAKIIPFPKKLH